METSGTAALTAMVAYDAGSRSERAEEHGVAHLLEHMVFKGGEAFPTHRDVNGETDLLGARLNALTGEEIVAFHIRVRAQRAIEAIELLTDIVGRPALDPGELEREKGVVVQEIARSADQPRSRVLDLSGPATFGDHPLGRSILGSERSVRSLTPAAIAGFRQRCWSRERGIILLVGNLSGLDDNRLAALLERLPAAAAPAPRDSPPPFAPAVVAEERDSEQSHLVLSWRPELDVADPRVRAAFTVYAMLLGGSMGSRLVTEIREERGWAYSVRAEADCLSDAAALYVSAGLDSANTIAAVERCREIVVELAAGAIGAEEIERARSAAAGRRALAFENSTVAASQLAEEHVVHDHQTDPASVIAGLDDVDDAEVAAVAAAITGPPSIACVGPHSAADFDR